MSQWYVSLWDSGAVPDGAPYTTVVHAITEQGAEFLARVEMAGEVWDDGAAADLNIPTVDAWAQHFADDIHLVDCFDLDTFIAKHRGDKL